MTRTATNASDRLTRATRPVVEGLEQRALFTVTVSTYLDLDGNFGLRIRGDNSAETVTVTEDPATGSVSVAGTGLAGGVYNSPPGVEFELFDVRLTGGDDVLNWNVISDYVDSSRSYMLDVGSGNDRLTFETFDNETYGDSNIDLEIDGDPGNDLIQVSFDDIYEDAKLFLDVHTETGNDTVTVSTLYVAEDASYEADFDLGSGTNNLTLDIKGVLFNALADIDIAGGTNGDTVIVNMYDDFFGRTFIDAALGAGNDTFTANLYEGFDVAGIFEEEADFPTEVRLNINGGTGNDTLKVVNYEEVEGALVIQTGGLFAINLIGGDGNDKLTVDLDGNDFTGSNGVGLDGTLKVRMDGGNQNDTLVGRFKFDPPSIGKADIQIRGGHHNDTASLVLFDFSISGINYVGGYALLDGGNQDFDVGNVVRNVLAKVRRQNFESGGTVIV